MLYRRLTEIVLNRRQIYFDISLDPFYSFVYTYRKQFSYSWPPDFVMFWPDNETLMYYYYFTIVNNSPTPAKQFLNHRFSRAPMYIFSFRHDFHRCLPEPVKAQEFLKKLTNHLYQDANIFALFERVADPDISCKDCSSAGVSFFTNQPQPKQ